MSQDLSFGQKAVDQTFIPSGLPLINDIKTKFAEIIDLLNDEREKTGSSSAKRYYSKAISYAEDAQMNSVKAATWPYE